jgi:arylsulfatase A-like enzyme
VNSTSRSSRPASLLAALLLCACEGGVGMSTPNLVMISVDTMRADRLGKKGHNGESLTPAMDAFAATATTFTAAYAASNETLFSHAGLFLGKKPSTFGPLDYATYRLRPDTPTLANRLAQAGWRTEAVVASGHLAPLFGMGAGFQRYQSTTHPFASFQVTVPEALRRLEVLSAGDRPFFLFVHGYDCHSPYIKPGPLHHSETPDYTGALVNQAENPLFWERLTDTAFFPEFQPPPLRTKDASFLDPAMFNALAAHAADPNWPREPLTADDIAFINGVYDSAVAYADTHVGRVLQAIDDLGIADNTVVVLFSDHGEDILAHGAMNHRISLHDENVHVPLIIRAPGLPPGRRDELVQLQDLTAPLLTSLGLADKPTFEELGRDYVFAESMLGEQSIRSARGRLRAHTAALAGPRPPEPGPTLELLDAAGQPLPWTDPLADELWPQLVEAAR